MHARPRGLTQTLLHLVVPRISASVGRPWFEGLFSVTPCEIVPCPANSFGAGVPVGCFCNAGFDGTVVATASSPFYTSTCSGVACPPLSNGSSVPAGCECDAGHSGTICPAFASESTFPVETCAGPLKV